MRLFKSKPQPVTPYFPEDTRVYCIGDIHGCLDLLKKLHKKITNHSKDYKGTKKLIYLGDYVDRGPDSKGVIDHLLSEPLAGFDITYLRGNHEQSILEFLAEPVKTRAWLNYGGLETLLSYGVRLEKLPSNDNDLFYLRNQLEGRFPKSHHEFISNTKFFHDEGSYYFCHAGIKPGTPLENQQPSDLMWIRDKFISSTQHHEKIIVHGHTISDEVDTQPNRTGIDTGAYASGKLTCLVLEGNRQRTLQTS